MKAEVIVHADWGTDATKRWYAEASWHGDRYRVSAPISVGSLRDFVPGLLQRAGSRKVLIGFDFPIGLPVAYAERVQEPDFVDFLLRLGTPPYDRFFDVARGQQEISVWRPFYPHRPGGTKQVHLLDALGLKKIDDLFRQCERASASRGQASPLFWTLGAKQVGKAAICGWRDVICPLLRESREKVAIWPFDGELSSLVESAPCVIGETYPAEACVQLGLPAPGKGWSKAAQADRVVKCRVIARQAEEDNVALTGTLGSQLGEGFGSGSNGEDQFDAFVGLIAMLRVARGFRLSGVPSASVVRKIEGWILGQTQLEPSM